jgi:hypothetical protein
MRQRMMVGYQTDKLRMEVRWVNGQLVPITLNTRLRLLIAKHEHNAEFWAWVERTIARLLRPLGARRNA